MASGGAARLGITSVGKSNKQHNRQLAIDVSRTRGGAAEKVADTEVAKQSIRQGIKISRAH